MRVKTVRYFSGRDEALAEHLMKSGAGRNVARVLVFLAAVPEANSVEIEKRTDLRESEVSTAVKYLRERGWITCRRSTSDRRVMLSGLAKSLPEIIGCIGKEKHSG
jgi:predicted transcriptional regulator